MDEWLQSGTDASQEAYLILSFSYHSLIYKRIHLRFYRQNGTCTVTNSLSSLDKLNQPAKSLCMGFSTFWILPAKLCTIRFHESVKCTNYC